MDAATKRRLEVIAKREIDKATVSFWNTVGQEFPDQWCDWAPSAFMTEAARAFAAAAAKKGEAK